MGPLGVHLHAPLDPDGHSQILSTSSDCTSWGIGHIANDESLSCSQQDALAIDMDLDMEMDFEVQHTETLLAVDELQAMQQHLVGHDEKIELRSSTRADLDTQKLHGTLNAPDDESIPTSGQHDAMEVTTTEDRLGNVESTDCNRDLHGILTPKRDDRFVSRTIQIPPDLCLDDSPGFKMTRRVNSLRCTTDSTTSSELKVVSPKPLPKLHSILSRQPDLAREGW